MLFYSTRFFNVPLIVITHPTIALKGRYNFELASIPPPWHLRPWKGQSELSSKLPTAILEGEKKNEVTDVS